MRPLGRQTRGRLGEGTADEAVSAELVHPRYDIIVVGAGVAGSCATIALAPLGYRILLLEQAIFPRHKHCGEGIMPPGVEELPFLG